MISARRATACGFSILAITAALPRVIFSPPPCPRAADERERHPVDAGVETGSRSERSFSVSADDPIVVSGRLTPLRAESLPATSTRVTRA